MKKSVIGTWELIDHPDSNSDPEERVFSKFTKNGDLTLTYSSREKDSKIFLIYKIDGDTLITDQPSHPQIEKSTMTFNGKFLEVVTDGEQSTYRKITLWEILLLKVKRILNI